jgi:hypothetical protein
MLGLSIDRPSRTLGEPHDFSSVVVRPATTVPDQPRLSRNEPWLEGRPLPMHAVVESNAAIVGNELALIEAAIGALRLAALRRPRAI